MNLFPSPPSTNRSIIHVDMDAFFASIEQRDFPELCGKPVVVGGLGPRGVVATASYEARAYGIRSAMPTSQARRLCESAIFMPARMGVYQEVSAQVFEVLAEFTPMIETLSLDEAFLDVTASVTLFGSAERIASIVKLRIEDRTQLTCSIGVAHNKLLAKIATELAKPNGVFVLHPEHVLSTLNPLPVRKLWTVGTVTANKLTAAGIQNFGAIRATSLPRLQKLVGKRAEALQKLASGIDDRPVVPGREEKSISAEETFDLDISVFEQVHSKLATISEKVANRLRKAHLTAQVVSLKLRSPPFLTETRQITLPEPTQSTDAIYRSAHRLLLLWWQLQKKPSLRLLGIGLAQLRVKATDNAQLPLLQGEAKPTDEVSDAIIERFGNAAIKRARGLAKNKPKRE